MDLLILPPHGNLPESVDREAREAALTRIEERCVRHRKEAIDFRESCGIEQTWLEDEAFYEGESRDERRSRDSRPIFQSNNVRRRGGNRRQRSRVFINVVETFTDQAASLLSNVVLPDGERPWDIEPTILPTLIEISEGNIPTDIDGAIAAEVRDGNETFGQPFTEEQAQAAIEAKRQAIQHEAEQIVNLARQAAERATKQIEDWQTECDARAELRKLVGSACKIGTGVIREPVLRLSKVLRYRDGTLTVEWEPKPVSVFVDPWNVYPDPAAGADPQQGEFHYERDRMLRSKLAGLVEDETYFADQIRRLIAERSETHRTLNKRDRLGLPRVNDRRLVDQWIGYEEIPVQDLLDLGGEFVSAPASMGIDEEGSDEGEAEPTATHPCRVTLADDRVIQISSSEVPSGSFPYSYYQWVERAEVPWGRGIPRQLHDIQRMVLNASRVMMENAGVAGGPMFVVNKSRIVPEDGTWEITPWKIWLDEGGEGFDERQDGAHHFRAIDVNMHQSEFRSIIELALRLAEDVTGMPVLLGGRHNDTTPDTVGGLKLLNTNASAPLARKARRLDDAVIKPGVRRYYEFALQHDRLSNYEHADMNVNASGSETMIQRNLQQQGIREIGELVQDPTFGIDPRKYAAQLLKSMGLVVLEFMYDDADWPQVVQSLKDQNQPDSTKLEVAAMQADVARMKLEYASQEKALDRELDLEIERMRRESGDLLTQVRMMESEQTAAIKSGDLSERERARTESTVVSLQEVAMKLDAMFKTEAMKQATARAIAREDRQARESQREAA